MDILFGCRLKVPNKKIKGVEVIYKQKNQFYFIILLSFFLMVELEASFSCYSEDKYPATHFLGLTKDKLPRIALVGKDINWDSKSAPIFEQTKTGWVAAGEKSCHPSWKCLMSSKKNCAVAIPEIKMTIKEALATRELENVPLSIEQKVSTCVQNGDDVYFGIEFYEGEGVDGVGGLGKYNTKTKEMEIRRLLPLKDTSVTNIVLDGTDLWISASSHYECTGLVPNVPLIRYNWDKNYIYNLKESDINFCGFNVHDMYYENNKLYIASDMGLTIGHREKIDYGDGAVSYEWRKPFKHYISDAKDPDKVVWTTCAGLYDKILDVHPMKQNKQLLETLFKFKPDYMLDKFLRLNNK